MSTPAAFLLLTLALLADLIASLVGCPADRSAGLRVAVTCYYGAWISWSAFVTWRLRRASGRRAALALLITLFVIVLYTIVISLAMGVRDYRPPLAVWITHGLMAATFLAAAVSLAMLRPPTERRPPSPGIPGEGEKAASGPEL
jgi:heme A synthase